MASDTHEVNEKITAAKVKRLKLKNRLHLNGQLNKEVCTVKQELANAETSTQIVKSKEVELQQIVQATDSGYRQTVALHEILARNISNTATRLDQLSLSKEKSSDKIKEKALEKLAAFPKEPPVRKQHEILTALVSHLAFVSEQDAETCANTQEEIKVLHAAIDENNSDAIKLEEEIAIMKEEIASLSSEVENATKIERQFQDSVENSSIIHNELQANLVEILQSIPDEVVVVEAKDKLKQQGIEIVALERMVGDLTICHEQLLLNLEQFDKESNVELIQLLDAGVKEEESLDGEIIDVEDEVSQVQLMLKGASQRKEIFEQKILRSHHGRTLHQLEEELDELESAQQTKLKQTEQEYEEQVLLLAAREKEIDVVLGELGTQISRETDVLATTAENIQEQDTIISKRCLEVEEELKMKQKSLEATNCEIKEFEQQIAVLKSNILEVTPKWKRNVSRDMQMVSVKIEPSIVLPVSNVPIIDGIQSFSPETIRKREERRKRNSRAIEYSLDYTDLSMDTDDNMETLNRPKAKQAAVKRSCKEVDMPTRSLRPKRRAAEKPTTVTKPKFTREPSNVSTRENSFEIVEKNKPVKPPPAFLDDSLYDDDSDFANQSMDSLFHDDLSDNNMRCIPQDIFLQEDQDSNFPERDSPAANVSENVGLDDSLDSEGSLDQSVWD